MSCTTAGMNELKGVHGSLCTHGQSRLSLYTKYICKNINFKSSFFFNYWVLLFYLEGTLSERFFCFFFLNEEILW